MVYLGHQTPEYLYLHEECNCQNTGMRKSDTRRICCFNYEEPTEILPHHFYFEVTRDPNTKDIDYVSTEERTTLMKQRLCFKCKKPRHCTNDPEYDPKHQQGGYIPLQKLKIKGKELHAHVRTLLIQMEKEEKEEFFEDAFKWGF